MIVVHPSLPVKDLMELIALLKANPGKYSYASPGYGTEAVQPRSDQQRSEFPRSAV
jgi:tripartite-type tricarboxylate transporter receptor subunit TctC